MHALLAHVLIVEALCSVETRCIAFLLPRRVAPFVLV